MFSVIIETRRIAHQDNSNFSKAENAHPHESARADNSIY